MKRGFKYALIAIIMVIILCTVYVWFSNNYLIINGEIYEIDATSVVISGEMPSMDQKFWQKSKFDLLDVRSIPLTTAEYDTLSAAMTDTEILWCVPFGDTCVENTSTQLVTQSISRTDFDNLKYFRNLELVDARGCTDYEMLDLLKRSYPEVTVLYTVTVGDQYLRENTTEVSIKTGEAEQLLEVLPMLDKLKAIDATQCSDYDDLIRIQKEYPYLEIHYFVSVCGTSCSEDATELTVENPELSELAEKLLYLPNVSMVTLTGLLPENDLILALADKFPDVTFDWEFEVCGVKTRSTAKELILSNVWMRNTDEVESSLKYFYNLERVEMCECGIRSEQMDELGKRHPETRFVWTIRIGYGKLRTDATAFIPFKIGFWNEKPFYDHEARELKYCIDLECLDLGHMRMRDISFLHYMPKLKYLIIADTVCDDYSVIGELTDLVYLEIFLTPLEDAEFLLNLTKLQNLNISWTRKLKNPEVLMKMTWLKRLWATKCNLTEEQNEQLKAALPDAVVYTNSKHPTEGGWRQSDLYYEMRDLLGMHYME